MKKPKLIIVDNDLTFRQSLIFLIHVEGCAEVIGKASSGFELVELLSHFTPDLILMNIDIPQLNGIEIVDTALKEQPDIKIVALTMFKDDAYISRLIKLGVKGFILKSSAIYELENDIRSLLTDANYRVNNRLINIINKMSPNRMDEPSISMNRKHTHGWLTISNVKAALMHKTKKLLNEYILTASVNK